MFTAIPAANKTHRLKAGWPSAAASAERPPGAGLGGCGTGGGLTPLKSDPFAVGVGDSPVAGP